MYINLKSDLLAYSILTSKTVLWYLYCGLSGTVCYFKRKVFWSGIFSMFIMSWDNIPRCMFLVYWASMWAACSVYWYCACMFGSYTQVHRHIQYTELHVQYTNCLMKLSNDTELELGWVYWIDAHLVYRAIYGTVYWDARLSYTARVCRA